MKLIFCPVCHDIVKLTIKATRSCLCDSSWGNYEADGLHATYGGDAIPLGIENRSFFNAVNNQPESGMGGEFEAFVIPTECATFKKEKA